LVLLTFLLVAVGELGQNWHVCDGFWQSNESTLVNALCIDSIRCKRLLMFDDNNVMARDKTHSSHLEVCPMASQNMAFCFLLFCFVYCDCQIVWDDLYLWGYGLGFCFIIIPFAIGETAKKG
jgi:hypothetical protein